MAPIKSKHGLKMIECPIIDRDAIEMDPSGYYFLIRVNFRQGFIECAVCHKDINNTAFVLEGEPGEKIAGVHIKEIYYGRCAQDIYHKIVESYPNGGTEYVTLLSHAAYLGKELKKAEMALVLGIPNHYQE